MTVQSPPPPPSYGGPVTPGAPKKKGLSPLAWVGIGCGAILVLGFIVMAVGGFLVARKAKQYADNPEMAAVELMVAANPDIELVSKDEDAKTVTLRNKQDGETITVSLEDVKNGNISFETSEGEASIQMNEEGMTIKDGEGNTAFQAGASTSAPKDLPDWVPVYPGGQIQGNMTSNTAEQKTASFSLTTQDSVDDLVKFYEEQLTAKGLEIEQTTTGTGADGGSTGMISAKSSDDVRNVIIMVSSATEGTGASAQVTYIEKK
ncbi:MAG TPA: hypothetical protein VEL74_19550 [Thermoanaerobaculia bacterium]|nr:hypothetical protein [Thermoanaerobaculia bacterium]